MSQAAAVTYKLTSQSV